MSNYIRTRYLPYRGKEKGDQFKYGVAYWYTLSDREQQDIYDLMNW